MRDGAVVETRDHGKREDDSTHVHGDIVGSATQRMFCGHCVLQQHGGFMRCVCCPLAVMLPVEAPAKVPRYLFVPGVAPKTSSVNVDGQRDCDEASLHKALDLYRIFPRTCAPIKPPHQAPGPALEYGHTDPDLSSLLIILMDHHRITSTLLHHVFGLDLLMDTLHQHDSAVAPRTVERFRRSRDGAVRVTLLLRCLVRTPAARGNEDGDVRMVRAASSRWLQFNITWASAILTGKESGEDPRKMVNTRSHSVIAAQRRSPHSVRIRTLAPHHSPSIALV